MIKLSSKGDFSKTIKYFNKVKAVVSNKSLDKYGEMGVEALKAATPVRTGLTASSWNYRIQNGNGTITIEWFNTNNQNGVNIAVLLQYGHGTRNGGYVQGRDYINPAMDAVFKQIAEEAWKEVAGA